MEKRILKLELILALFLFFIPVVLIGVTNEIRPSISDYAYSKSNDVFTALLTIAGALFIYNGVINREKWYNIVLGCSLIGIGVTPHLDYAVLHYSFAALFFIGSIAVMIIYSSQQQRFLKVMLALIVLTALIGCFAFKWYSLLVAEWIGLIPIAVHFIGESTQKLD
ncbi:hypothetical protein K5I29_04300 [Flavobacterium agricola]|uniref:Uncharacterized protein n=1 Tax=Flavobacterium agricola TaxID=2870839 RepID=A0ABY6M3V0_9FLAO|nr:hypothetical protein [Flavobacterium agricola]UYW02128.1 hypothetical protein K5I29_04300 [Flavobacterium agricola]